MSTTYIIILLLATLIILVLIVGFMTLRSLRHFFYRILDYGYNFNYRYMNVFDSPYYRFLADQEMRNDIRLSEEAKQLLVLPLIEMERMTQQRLNPNIERYDFELWRESVQKLMEYIRENPARLDETYERSSQSVIKAFAKKFCNIPPFCGER